MDPEPIPEIAERIWDYDLLERVCIQAECMPLDEAFQASGVKNWRNAVQYVERAERHKRERERE